MQHLVENPTFEYDNEESKATQNFGNGKTFDMKYKAP